MDQLAALRFSADRLRRIVEPLDDPTLSPDGSTVAPAPADRPTDGELPAEAFVRLVYGRMDPDHTPAGAGGEPLLAALRQAFAGP